MSPVPLHTMSWGDGERRLLLVHGLASNAAGWWRMGPALAGAGFSVTAPDLRGHGHSPGGDGYGLDDHAADLLALGEAWEVVLAHSYGAAAAVMALRSQPHWAGRVVLEDPALVLPDPDIAAGFLLGDFDHPLTAESVSARNPTWHQQDCRHKAEALVQCGPETIRRIVYESAPANLVPAVAALAVPTLLVGAGVNPVLPPGLGEELAAANPSLSFVHVPGSSHSIHRDRFDELWEVVKRFLLS